MRVVEQDVGDLVGLIGQREGRCVGLVGEALAVGY